MIWDFLKLIRIKNLLIVVILQYLLLYCLIKPMLQYHYSLILGIYITPAFSDFDFFILVLSSVLITAAGYIINDYFDLNIDMINKPDKVILGKKISLRTAQVYHWVFTIVGILLGFYISWKIDMLNLGFIFIVTSGLLWYYSTVFKRELIIGNVIVATLTALTPLLVLVYQIIPLNLIYKNQLLYYYLNFNDIVFWILGFALFAFLLTLIREIIKDMEDLEGDSAYGRKSIPIVWGMNKAKCIVVVLQSIFIFLVSWAIFVYIEDIFTPWYLIITIIVPSIFNIGLVIKANRINHFTLASKISKGIMIFGILYLIPLYFLIKNAL